jgi:hypothetical protein
VTSADRSRDRVFGCLSDRVRIALRLGSSLRVILNNQIEYISSSGWEDTALLGLGSVIAVGHIDTESSHTHTAG